MSDDDPEAVRFSEATVAWVRRNTITEGAAKACLIRLGIHDEDGNLTPEYQH